MDPFVLLFTCSVAVGPDAPTSKMWLQSSPPPDAVVGAGAFARVGSRPTVGLGSGVSVGSGVGGAGVLVGTAATVSAIIVLAAAIAEACTCSGLTVGAAGAQALNSNASAIGTNNMRCIAFSPFSCAVPNQGRVGSSAAANIISRAGVTKNKGAGTRCPLPDGPVLS